MSDYWRRIVAVLQREAYGGTEEELEATYRIIEQIVQAETVRDGAPATPLAELWDLVQNNVEALKLEPYIDDQFEITEVWEATEELLKKGGLESEPWELKEEILRACYENNMFDEFGMGDPMGDLVKAMCTTEEEIRKREAIHQSVLDARRAMRGSRRRW